MLPTTPRRTRILAGGVCKDFGSRLAEEFLRVPEPGLELVARWANTRF
jgi:hypothetical protein